MAKIVKKTVSPVFWGLSIHKWREIFALGFIFLSILFLAALISYACGRHWMGSIGITAANAIRNFFGRFVCYVVPALLILAAFHAFRGSIPFHPVRKLIAGILILTSLCALLTLPYALEPDADTASFNVGGILGNFITNPEGLGLVNRVGVLGAFMVLFGAFVLGLMLSTEFLFVPMLRHIGEKLHEKFATWRRPAPVATLSFGRDGSRRKFPVSMEKDKSSEDPAKAFTRSEGEPADLFAKAEEDLFAIPEEAAGKGKKGKAKVEALAMTQTELDFISDDYELPSLDLLSNPPPTTAGMDREEVQQISGELEQALADFNISARVVAVTQGPVVTQYELQPAPGVKVSRIINLENDIALVLRAKSVRIQAPIPGKAAIGVEVPNRKVTPVYFKEIIDSDEFRRHPSPLAFAVGKNISGDPVICDLAEMPHLLIAGTTGSGKSVCINVIICSILYRMPPDKVKFIMVDPKRVELNSYSDIPHLLAPVVNEPRQAAAALAWAVQQMEERLQLFSELKVRNIQSYNTLVTGQRAAIGPINLEDKHPLPYIVIIIDELADLMLIARNEVEEFVIRLAQMSRAAGIHMIIATQRPSVNVITGIIKANFPSRIAFRVSAKVDSRTILDMNGAETLLGRGDMLFAPGGTKPMRVQGAFLSDPDVEVLTNFLRSKNPAVYEHEEFVAAPLPAIPAVNPLEQPDLVEEALGASPEEDDDDTTISRTSTGVSFGTPPPTFTNQPSKAFDPSSAPDFTRASALPSGQVSFPSISLKADSEENDEELYDRALRMVLESRKPSVSMIQRRMKIGFARAGRLMDLMEERGIVGPYQGSKPRELLIDDPEALLKRLNEIERNGGY